MTTPSGNDVEAVANAFEEWMASSNYPEIADIALAKLPDGNYRSQLTFAAWQAWQAAIAALNVPALVQAEREAVIADLRAKGWRSGEEVRAALEAQYRQIYELDHR